MRILCVAALAWFAFAAPASAQTTDADVMAPIQKFIDSFNKGDTAAAAATHAAGADLTIIDEVPPYVWRGAKAFQAWSGDLESDAKKNGITESMVTLSNPTRIERNADQAYVVVPAVYSFKQKGTAMREAAQMTVVLRRGASGWVDVDRAKTTGGRGAKQEVAVSRDGAVIGVSDHAGWAVLVTVAADGKVLDSRRVELVAGDLPPMPIHHDAQKLPLEQAVDLVERVRVSAEQHAMRALDDVASAVDSPIRGIALRTCPPLPPTVAEQLQNYRAKNVADWVMYRMALAGAAQWRGWSIHWYDAKKVAASVCTALRVQNLDAYFREARTAFGPPWNNDHKVATAAALSARFSPKP